MKIELPPADERTKAELRADEKPPQADDPRPALDRNVGSPWAAGS